MPPGSRFWARHENAHGFVVTVSVAGGPLRPHPQRRPTVQAFTEGHDLDVDALLTGDHTVYLYAPAHEQRRLRPLFETVTMQVVRAAQEKAARAPDGTLDPRLLLALDEAGNVAALAELPELATTARGQGIQLLSADVWKFVRGDHAAVACWGCSSSLRRSRSRSARVKRQSNGTAVCW
jgi:Type IV secretory system Conjugative DNA transfer